MSHDKVMDPSGDSTQEDDFSLLDALQVVVENLRLLVLGPLLIGLAALGITFAIPPTFTAKVVFIPPKQQQSTAASALADLASLGSAGMGGVSGLKNPAEQYVALLKSNSVADAVIARYDLQIRYNSKYLIDARRKLATNTKVTVGVKDGLITVEFDDKEPTIAAEVGNAYVEELRKLLNRLALTEAQMRRVFFEQLVKDTKNQMLSAETALKASGVDSTVLKLSAGAALEGVARLKAQISVQEVKLASMRGYLAESAPEFKQALNELRVLREQILLADQNESKKIGSSNYIANFREFKYQEALLELYQRQYEMARLDESREGAVVQVVDYAQKPERPSSPNRLIIVMISIFMAELLILIFIFASYIIGRAEIDANNALKLKILRATFNKSLRVTINSR